MGGGGGGAGVGGGGGGAGVGGGDASTVRCRMGNEPRARCWRGVSTARSWSMCSVRRLGRTCDVALCERHGVCVCGGGSFASPPLSAWPYVTGSDCCADVTALFAKFFVLEEMLVA